MPKPGYRLDESDSDVLVLRREDGSVVAAFSARGATREGIVEAAEEDRPTGHALRASGPSEPRAGRSLRTR